jgi:hypothetical protein
MMKVASLLILGMIWLWPPGLPIDPPPAPVVSLAANGRAIPVESSLDHRSSDLGRSGVSTDACLVEEEEEDPSDELGLGVALDVRSDALLRGSVGASAHLRPRRIASRSALPSFHLRC